MTIQLVGFDALKSSQKYNLFKKIVNESSADLILFPGNTFRDEADIMYEGIDNKHSVIIIELGSASPTSCMGTTNELYIFRNGRPIDMFSCQIFATADDINRGGKNLMNKLFDELESRRRITCCGKSIVILQCGETALLACPKATGYKAEFRFKDAPEMNKRYEKLLSTTDIFLNPIHTVQGEQGIMKQRRIALSANGRYYLSTAALSDEMEGKLNSKRLQYIYYNSRELTVDSHCDQNKGYVSRTIEI